MTTRPGPHLGMPTAREREIAAALHAECKGKQVVRVTAEYLAKPSPAWRHVHIDPSTGRAAREAADAKRNVYKHPPEPVDQATGLRMYFVRRANRIPQADLVAYLSTGAADRGSFIARFNLCTHSLMALARMGRVVLGRRKGRGGKTNRGCCVGYVALPGQVVAA